MASKAFSAARDFADAINAAPASTWILDPVPPATLRVAPVHRLEELTGPILSVIPGAIAPYEDGGRCKTWQSPIDVVVQAPLLGFDPAGLEPDDPARLEELATFYEQLIEFCRDRESGDRDQIRLEPSPDSILDMIPRGQEVFSAAFRVVFEEA